MNQGILGFRWYHGARPWWKPIRIYRSKGSYWRFGMPTAPSWVVHIQFGPGWGYRWIDFPGHSMDVKAPWWRHLSIPGVTFCIGRNVKFHRVVGFKGRGLPYECRSVWVGFPSNQGPFPFGW